MKIAMLCIGSTGDVLPCIRLGRVLKERGHEITVTAFPPFEEKVKAAGLNFRGLPGNVVTFMSNLMKPGVTGFTFLAQVEKSLRDVAPQMLDALLESCKEADAMMCTYFGSMYYSMAEKCGIPCIQTMYYPMDPTDVMPISTAPGRKLGKLWNQATYRLGYTLIGILEKRYLTQWRLDNNMSIRKLEPRPNYQIGRHTVPVIYAISPLVMPRPASWGSNIHLSGFWLDDPTDDGWQPSPELEAFMAAGDKPIYIGFGSMTSGDMEKTFAIVLRAIHASGVRAIINTGWSGARVGSKSTKNVFFAEYIPHNWLFSRVKAVVHHGGAGTTAAGLRAGKPTLVIPFGGDQPFWGDRVHALGCGPKPINRRDLTVAKLTRALVKLSTRTRYQIAAEELALNMSKEDGLNRAADITEHEIQKWINE